MYRSIPTVNRIIQKKWNEKLHSIHCEQLKKIRSLLKITTPRNFTHLKTQLKRRQLLEGKRYIEKHTEIDRENRVLMEKMTVIFSSKPQKPVLTKKCSLNNEARKRELRKITAENRAILKRLRDKKPNYNVLQWELERKEQVKRLNYLCEYPYLLNERSFTRLRNSPSPTRSTPTLKRRSLHTSTTVFRKHLRISGHNFQLRIKRIGEKLHLSCISTENCEKFTLEIPFNEDYEGLCEQLEFLHGELRLIKEN